MQRIVGEAPGAGGPGVTVRHMPLQGGGLVFAGQRHLSAAVGAFHRLLVHHGV